MLGRGITVPILLGVLLLAPMAMFAGLKGLSSQLGSQHPYRVWTDSSGRFSAKAKLQTNNGLSVVLEKADGAIVKVPVNRLSEIDQRYLSQGESDGGQALFPYSFSQWNYSNPNDLWAVVVQITPMWVPVAISALVSVAGALRYRGSHSA